MKCPEKLILLMIIVLQACICSSPTRGGERPSVREVRLYNPGGRLAVEIEIEGIFSPRILGTVRSGLPAVVELFYHISQVEGKNTASGIRSFSLNYDVWEDVYSLAGEDTTFCFNSLEGLRRAAENLRIDSLLTAGRYSLKDSYRLKVGISVNPLRGTDKRKIDSWVRENVRSGEEGSWREHVLNLNELISHFFSSSDNDSGKSEWYSVPPFKPEQLPEIREGG